MSCDVFASASVLSSASALCFPHQLTAVSYCAYSGHTCLPGTGQPLPVQSRHCPLALAWPPLPPRLLSLNTPGAPHRSQPSTPSSRSHPWWSFSPAKTSQDHTDDVVLWFCGHLSTQLTPASVHLPWDPAQDLPSGPWEWSMRPTPRFWSP